MNDYDAENFELLLFFVQKKMSLRTNRKRIEDTRTRATYAELVDIATLRNPRWTCSKCPRLPPTADDPPRHRTLLRFEISSKLFRGDS